jgi:transcriptional regulator with XRE-family HTH domain
VPADTTYLKQLLARLTDLREDAEISREQMEERLILGPGWIERFETGESIPSFDMLLAMLHIMGKNLGELLEGLPSHPDTAEIERFIFAEQNEGDLLIHFKYANHDATYTLRRATTDEFEQVIKTLRDGLSRLVGDESEAESIKTEAVTQTFLKAIELWPHASPSDLWWFVVYRAYCDPFNHPAPYARLDFSQSWKRTGGWALEQILVCHYGPYLKEHGITLMIAPNEIKERYLKTLNVSDRLEADKMDVLLFGSVEEEGSKEEVLFGVVHVKASFAERRTDDVPMSKSLVDAGYVSPLWTMDCKSTPSESPVNRGELGPAFDERDDRRSAKRKDIEDDGYFSACFSYNSNTKPTPIEQDSKAKVYVCNFQNPNDEFSQFIISAWQSFLQN